MKNKLKEELNAHLSGITMSEALKRRVLNQVRKEEQPVMKRKISLSIIIAIALTAVAAVAFALTDGFGLFDLMGRGKQEEYSKVQKEAYDLVQKNPASASFDHVDVAVTEAVYDGKYLRIAYATTERDAEAPFDVAKVFGGEFNFEAAEKDGVSWNTLDGATVNGTNVNPVGETGVNAGNQNGETIAWLQFDLTEISIGDELTVDLPIRGRQSIDNKELSFTMTVTDLPGVKYISAVPDVQFADYSLHLADMLISPIRVYVKVEMTANAGVTAERCNEIMWEWTLDGILKGEGENNPFISSGGGSSAVLENVEYAGEDFKVKVIDETKPTRFMVEFEFLTRDSYPDTFVLTNGKDSLVIPNEMPVNR